MRKLAVYRATLILFLAVTLVLVSIVEAATWSYPSMVAEDDISDDASISGDGGKIAFTGYDKTKEPPSSGWASETNIFVINSDGTGLTQLTNNTEMDRNPSISDDGSKIAFNNFVDSGLKSPSTEIFVINSDGTELTQLTNNTKWNTGPS